MTKEGKKEVNKWYSSYLTGGKVNVDLHFDNTDMTYMINELHEEKQLWVSELADVCRIKFEQIWVSIRSDNKTSPNKYIDLHQFEKVFLLFNESDENNGNIIEYCEKFEDD